MTRTKHLIWPYSVRKQSSKYSDTTRWSVVCNPGGQRVYDVPPMAELNAWRRVDELSISHYASQHGYSWPIADQWVRP